MKMKGKFINTTMGPKYIVLDIAYMENNQKNDCLWNSQLKTNITWLGFGHLMNL